MEEVGQIDPTKEDIHLLTIFPVEVWLQVIQNIRSPADLRNFSLASCFWNKLTHEFKTERFLELLFANLFVYLERKDVLSLRLVCLAWQKGVDRFLEYLSLTGNNNCAFTSLEKFGKQFHPRNAHIFIEKMSIHRGNPFPSRSLWISEQGFGCFAILQQFGRFVNHARLHLQGTDLEILEYLRIALIRMPKLHSLNLVCFLHPSSILSEADIQNINFPELPNLHRVKLSWLAFNVRESSESCPDAFHIYKTFSKYSTQLRNLELLPLRSATTFPLSNYSYPGLSQLDISVTSWLELDSLHIALLNAPLEILSLNILNPLLCQNMARVLAILNSFNQTLTQLELSLPIPISPYYIPVMEFPNLNRLQMKASHISSLDFVSQLKSLRVLTIQSFITDFNELQRQPLELIGYSSLTKYSNGIPSMYESNIWKILGNLHTLYITFQEVTGAEVSQKKFTRSYVGVYEKEF